MDINYELYKVFLLRRKTLSFSEASKCLYISQSAVSQSVKVLEKSSARPSSSEAQNASSSTPGRRYLI